MSAHTPKDAGKWIYRYTIHQDGIGEVRHDVIAYGPEPALAERRIARASSEANAAFIVKAVNCHDELVEALEALLSACENCTSPQASTLAALGNARAAVQKAKGE